MAAPPPPGSATTSTAAALIGVSPDRVRQLIRGGHATSPGRGLVNLASLLSGYTRQLRASATRPASAALARHQSAKAALISDATEARSAELVDAAEAQDLVRTIARIAVDHTVALTKPNTRALKGLPPDLVQKAVIEAASAIDKIGEAEATALLALRSGDFTEIVG